ncbi:DUF4279 domain-containing protein [Rhizobiales bacterium RZME27]|jgi:hypothetical protein|uniref:DUF4279 domain-containing protein n=1 Tax=Endobacterium cereale TaxID=2663029 RepID=A0A6A8AAI8_9HYPH|nr:DUF4279 domain-containing protein [Endobacterium cereale]MEB2848006.1 DUF4279 domain-containing protein [Endobacterium cereale]MQY46660.1 DUF4279 domain-containing protein [Endobacterium cereale]
MASSIRIDFSLFDTAQHPREVTQLLGIKPDKEVGKGERNEKLSLPRQSIWSLMSSEGDMDVEHYWKEIYSKLGPVVEDVEAVSASATSRITIIINVDGRLPSVIIPPSMSFFASKIGANIDIDYYE